MKDFSAFEPGKKGPERETKLWAIEPADEDTRQGSRLRRLMSLRIALAE